MPGCLSKGCCMRFSAGVVALLLLATVSVLPARAWAAPSDATTQPGLDELELRLFGLTNAERARNGLVPVELDLAALDIARARAAAQLGAGPLSHADATGQPAFVGL